MAVDDELESEESVDLATADAGDIEEQEAALAPDDDDDDNDEASLDELLAQRASARRGGNDSEEEDDDDDIMALSSEKDTQKATVLPSKVIPIKDQEEFVCKSCYLVKARSQLADATRMYCRDCA